MNYPREPGKEENGLMMQIEEKVERAVKRSFRHENTVLITVLVTIMTILAIVTKGLSVSKTNIINIWAQSSTRGIATIGQFFALLSGGLDLSVGGVAGLSGMMGAICITSGHTNIIGHPLPLGVGVVIVLLTALGVGLINGLLVSRVGVSPLIVTLGMWTITGGITYLLCRGFTVSDLPRSLAFFAQTYVAGVAMPIIIFIAIIGLSYFVLYHTTFGRSVYAVGGNVVSAWLSGINIKNTQLSVYMISSFLAGICGLILVSRTMAAALNTGVGLELDSITAACLGGVSLYGGRGTLLGTVIGVMIIGVISNGMNILAVEPALQKIVKGAILITAVAIDVQRRRR